MNRVRTILLPTDFSTYSRQAEESALRLAREYEAELYVMRVADAHSGAATQDALDISRSRLEELRKRAAGDSVSISYEEVRSGAVAPAILDHAEEIDSDLIVMGTHGRRGPDRWFVGSVAAKVVRYARCPVLTARERDGAQASERKPGEIRRVLAPIDFSDHSEAGIIAGKEVATKFGATLQLLHVVDVDRFPAFYGLALENFTDEAIAHSVERLWAAVKAVPDPVDRPRLAVEVHATSGHAASGIVDFAVENDSDLIVMPSVGRTGMSRWFVGSTAERVVGGAPCPVLTLKNPSLPSEPQYAEKIGAVVKG